MPELTTLDWTLLAGAAFLVGVAKTSVGGVAAISVAVFADVLPARESTGALLPLLLLGDLFAVRVYRAHADWARLLRLVPSVTAGVVVGAVFVGLVDDTVMRRTIGAALLALVAIHLWQQHRRSGTADLPYAHGRGRTWGYGALAGFTTMVANSGGAVMSLYLLASGVSLLGFLGTTAWFFFVVNAVKVPFSVHLDLISLESLQMNAALVPAVLVGAYVGRIAITHVDLARFERVVLVVTVGSSLNLLR